MSARRRAILIAVVFFLIGVFILMSEAAPKPSVGIVYIDGTIVGGGSGVTSSGETVTGSDDVVAYLRAADNDPAVYSIVLRINSPGGSAAAAQEIAVEMAKLREHGKAIVASLGDVGASGGYWIAAGADKIMANPATTTGSIGVIMELQNLQGLYDKLGIKNDVVKTGPYKDIGSPYRDVTADERQLLEAMVGDVYNQFVDHVSQGRGLPDEKVRALADGRMFTGRQALAEGLVDEMGNFSDAVDQAAAIAGLGSYSVIEYGRDNPFDSLLGRLLQGLFGRLTTTPGASALDGLLRGTASGPR